MQNLLIPFLVSVFFVTIGCNILRIFWHAPYNFICAIWLTLTFAATIPSSAIFSMLKWPFPLYWCSILVPFTVLFYLLNFKKHVDENLPEVVWGRYVYGGFLIITSTVLAFQKVFFLELMEVAQSVWTSTEVLYFYLSVILIIGLSGVVAILKGADKPS